METPRDRLNRGVAAVLAAFVFTAGRAHRIRPEKARAIVDELEACFGDHLRPGARGVRAWLLERHQDAEVAGAVDLAADLAEELGARVMVRIDCEVLSALARSFGTGRDDEDIPARIRSLPLRVRVISSMAADLPLMDFVRDPILNFLRSFTGLPFHASKSPRPLADIVADLDALCAQGSNPVPGGVNLNAPEGAIAAMRRVMTRLARIQGNLTESSRGAGGATA